MIESKVEAILRKNLPSRDDDRELQLAWIFYEESMIEEEKKAFDVFKVVVRRMPSLETLTRARRLLQANNPYLRGENYQKRQSREKQLRQFYKQQ